MWRRITLVMNAFLVGLIFEYTLRVKVSPAPIIVGILLLVSIIIDLMEVMIKTKRIELGDGHIVQHTIFENKKIGGIWLYNWQTIKQNRFHTHAFSSYAFLLRGSYTEEVIVDSEIIQRTVNQWLKPRYLPKNYTHRILKAEPNTWTIVFFGKWIPYWWEYFDDTKTWIKYSWGRKVVKKVNGDETTKIV